MSSVARSIIEIWQNDPGLCALVPYSRVYSGRVPPTDLYRFPYVSILLTNGRHILRTSVANQSFQLLDFSIWVDANQLYHGEKLCEAITDVYADRCWPVDERLKVMDCLDEGPASPRQLDLPTVKCWNFDKMFLLRLERLRADHEPCCDSSASTSEPSSSASESWPEASGSLSIDSAGGWPQDIVT